jgi:hypothetical protein
MLAGREPRKLIAHYPPLLPSKSQTQTSVKTLSLPLNINLTGLLSSMGWSGNGTWDANGNGQDDNGQVGNAIPTVCSAWYQTEPAPEEKRKFTDTGNTEPDNSGW